ncbi:hypothetical protein VKT23_004623 [Stygiomarasmius scandens]|uniref:Uncharacterized protein n=1 Tax=Marasmiellus scandens TaxID=2682957 RepID=A0ABR1JXT0_9AGAR
MNLIPRLYRNFRNIPADGVALSSGTNQERSSPLSDAVTSFSDTCSSTSHDEPSPSNSSHSAGRLSPSQTFSGSSQASSDQDNVSRPPEVELPLPSISTSQPSQEVFSEPADAGQECTHRIIPRPPEIDQDSTHRCLPDFGRELLSKMKVNFMQQGAHSKAHALFQKRVWYLVQELLDESLPLERQDQTQVALLREKLADEYPILYSCEQLWAVDVMLQRQIMDANMNARRRHFYRHELFDLTPKKGRSSGAKKNRNGKRGRNAKASGSTAAN